MRKKLTKVLLRNSTTAVNEILRVVWNMGSRDPQRLLTLASLRLHELQGRPTNWAQQCIRIGHEYRALHETDEHRTFGPPDPRPPRKPPGPKRAA